MGIPVMERFLVKGGTVTSERWKTWRTNYIRGRGMMRDNFIDASKLQNTLQGVFISPQAIYGSYQPIQSYTSLTSFKRVFPAKEQTPVGIVFLGGGYGGRLFGYIVPEEDRIKILAPVLKFKGKDGVTPLEIRLRYLQKLKQAGYPIFPSIMANDVNSDRIKEFVERGLRNWQTLVEIFAQVGLPRLIPHSLDLAQETKFKKHITKDTEKITDAEDIWVAANRTINLLGTPGEILLTPKGAISRKPPGHMDGLTLYILTQMKKDLENGVRVTLINGGEEIGFLYNPPLINWVLENSKPLTFIFHELSIGTKGGGVFKYDERDQIFDGCQIDQSQGFPAGVENITKNLFQVAVHLPSLLGAMGLTETGFLSMSEDEIREVLDRQIYVKLNPLLEIKPVGAEKEGIWGAQLVYLFGQASSIFETNLIMGDAKYFPFPELKEPEDVKKNKINEFTQDFYEKF